MTCKTLTRLLAGVSATLMLAAAGSAFAADAADAPAVKSMGSAGGEGTDVSEVVVVAEHNQAAADAPAKASLAQVQPEAIISRAYIEQAVPEIGDYTSAVMIAPSMSGVAANGGGIGDYNKTTLRGFQDGQYNLTYDGISFGDTNDPTHHPADYFPASTIGAVVVDRGPGAAGDLGQANFGGAIHMFSMAPTDTFGAQQKATYGSFNTIDLVTTLNTGALSALGGGKLLLNLEERQSNGELSNSGGNMANQLIKYVLPIGDAAVLTVFGDREYTRFNLADAGPGETWQQTQLYGKNFALNNKPGTEFYYGYNYEAKASDFYYIDLKGQVAPSVTAENQLYTYFYSNKTTAANDTTGLVGGPNTSLLQNSNPAFGRTATTNPNDIGGYDKLNLYRVWGDVVRVNKEWSFGVLKVGGIVETSSTDRHNGFIDLSNGGAPDLKFASATKYPLLPGPTNYKLQEDSSWLQGQFFADFDWNVTDNLKLSPGFKFVDFKRDVNAANENVAGGTKNQPLVTSNTYTKPLYFFTANYKIMSDWSLYGQVATSFLVPSLSALYDTASAASAQSLQPEQTISYQAGTVYTHGDLTADADVYRIDATNLYLACNLPNPIAGNASATVAGYCNNGSARYTGVEGEGAYHLPLGMTVFVNGSINNAKQLANAGNAAEGIAANAARELDHAPAWTDAAGVLYNEGPWRASLTYKQSGAFVVGYNGNQGIHLPGYDTFDGSVGYDFGRYAIKLQGFNLLDRRAITDFSGATLFSTADTGQYTFQAGREILATLSARF
jgi:iron complex outermembrane receptor protein